jgi:hypothetical protein
VWLDSLCNDFGSKSEKMMFWMKLEFGRPAHFNGEDGVA